MLGEDPFRKRLTSFSVSLPRTVCSFGNDFIALEMKESLLTFHDDNFCKFHVLYAPKGDAWALRTRGRFATEREKNKRTKRKPKFKPRLHCLGNEVGHFGLMRFSFVKMLFSAYRLLLTRR